MLGALEEFVRGSRSPGSRGEDMRKYAGATCLVLGIVLSGLETDESIHSRWSRMFSGWAGDRQLVVGVALSLIVGLSLWLLSGKMGPQEKS